MNCKCNKVSLSTEILPRQSETATQYDSCPVNEKSIECVVVCVCRLCNKTCRLTCGTLMIKCSVVQIHRMACQQCTSDRATD